VEYLLLRQHVSALALGHHQVSNCVSEETIQCNIHIALIIQRDLVDNTPRLSIPTAHPLHLLHNHAHFTHGECTPDIAYDLYFIIPASFDNYQWSRYQRDLVG